MSQLHRAAIAAVAEIVGNATDAPSTISPPHSPHNEEQNTSFEYLMICISLVAIILAAHVVHKLRLVWISESGAIILVGIAVGGFLKLIDHFRGTDLVGAVRFNHIYFDTIILPVIIFEAGYSLRHSGVMRNLGPILLLAIIGTLMGAFIIGGIIYGVISPFQDAEGGLFIALAVGSLLSATDTVSIISLLSARFDMSREPPLLFSLLFGESMLNDAVAIVLFQVFREYITGDVTGANVMEAFGKFLLIFISSAVIGYAMGILCALLFRFVCLDDLPHLQVATMIIFGASSYYVCASVEFSGIMGVFVCARIIGHHASHNISRYARECAPFVFKMLAGVCDAAVFFLLGTAVFAYEHKWNAKLCAITIFACLLGRTCGVFTICNICNRFRTGEKISLQIQAFLTYSGLRGAIAFGLAVILYGEASKLSIPERLASEILSTTLCVILCTILIIASPAPLVLSALGLDRNEEEDEEAHASGMGSPSSRDAFGSNRSFHMAISPTLSQWIKADGEKSFGIFVRYLEKRFIHQLVRRPRRKEPIELPEVVSGPPSGGEQALLSSPLRSSTMLAPPAQGGQRRSYGSSNQMEPQASQFLHEPRSRNRSTVEFTRRSLQRSMVLERASAAQCSGSDDEEPQDRWGYDFVRHF